MFENNTDAFAIIISLIAVLIWMFWFNRDFWMTHDLLPWSAERLDSKQKRKH